MRIVASGPGFIASGPDVARRSVTVRGKAVYFDFDYRFGPLVTDREGSPLDKQPTSERDPFWGPFNAWLAAYRKTNPPPSDKPTPHPSDHLDRRPSPEPSGGE